MTTRPWFYCANFMKDGKNYASVSGIIYTPKIGNELFEACIEMLREKEKSEGRYVPSWSEVLILALNRAD